MTMRPRRKANPPHEQALLFSEAELSKDPLDIWSLEEHAEEEEEAPAARCSTKEHTELEEALRLSAAAAATAAVAAADVAGLRATQGPTK
jgi:hypothetical protein